MLIVSPFDLIERFWKLEDYGAVFKVMRKDTTRLVDGRYVGILWKKDERWFPNNLVMARQRLES